MSMVFESQQEAHDEFIEHDDVSDSDSYDNDVDDFNEGDYDDTPLFRPSSDVDDFIGESSVVFDVDDLVAEFEADSERRPSPAARLRKRLEALAERKRRHAELMDFDDYELD